MARGSWPSRGSRHPADEREQTISGLCEGSARRLAVAFPGCEIQCVLVLEDLLRQVAREGRLRVIYEIPREYGGVAWRAVERGATELVRDVASDPDYIAVDDVIRSEIAAPVTASGRVVAVLNVESPGRHFDEADAKVVEREAERLGRELTPLYQSERSLNS